MRVTSEREYYMIPTMFFAQNTGCKTVISQQIRARILRLGGWGELRVDCICFGLERSRWFQRMNLVNSVGNGMARVQFDSVEFGFSGSWSRGNNSGGGNCGGRESSIGKSSIGKSSMGKSSITKTSCGESVTGIASIGQTSGIRISG